MTSRTSSKTAPPAVYRTAATPHQTPRAARARRRRRAVALVLAVVAGAFLAARSGPADASEYASPAGRFVTVDGTRLYLACAGTGTPTVVLEAGLGGNHLDWARVQPRLGAVTRTCGYDRAGYGWSQPAPHGPRNLQRLAWELTALLEAAGEAGPFVLVGHSLGGGVVQQAAADRPERVVGLVLVDSVHPEQFARFANIGTPLPTEARPGMLRRDQAYWRGLDLPAPYVSAMRLLAATREARGAAADELAAMRAGLADLPPTGPRPMAVDVLTHGRRDWDRLVPDGRMERVWSEMQADLARRHAAPPPRPVPGAGHDIPAEAPEAVIAAVHRVLARIAGRRE